MRLARISSRVASSGASRSMTSSNVRLASSIIAHSSPSISTPWGSKRSGSTRRGSLPSSAIPSALASRFAGSIVTTATFIPCAAMPIASAAEVVVLPTPPEPAQMTMRLPSSSGTTDVIAVTNAVSDKAFAHGVRDGLGTAAGVELRHNVVQDVLHGPLGVRELERDLARRVTLRDQRQHLLLALGQAGERRAAVDALGGHSPEQVAEEVGRDHAGAAGRGLDRGGERVRRQRVLAQEADGAGLEGGEHGIVARLRGAHQHARAGRLDDRADEVLTTRHGDLEEHKFG